MKVFKPHSLTSKITIGFIFTIMALGMAIFFSYEFFNINTEKKNFQQLTKNCSASAAYALFNMPVQDYLENGKNEQYEEHLEILNSICKTFGLKYLYVYIPDMERNILTTIFYVDGKSDGNVKNRDLGTKVKWNINQIEKDIFAGKINNHVFVTDNAMGHTITSYSAVFDKNGNAIALVGADIDFDTVKNAIIQNITKTIIIISVCLIITYIILMMFLEKILIRPVSKISSRMNNFIKDKGKPFKPLKVKSNDEIGLMAKAFNKMVFDINRYIKQITDTQAETIFSLAKLAQSRDCDTGKHLERVQEYCRLLSGRLAENSPYSRFIDKTFIENIVNASPLHDIGKVGIADAILLKQDKLTEEEYNAIKNHTTIGYDTLREVHSKFGDNSFIEMGMTVALCHHERWDGKGYPNGLKGEKIPLAARIMAVADVYDALSSKRSYKEGFDNDKCIKIIKEGKGTAFDPIVVDAFLDIQDKFFEVKCRMGN